MKNEELKEHERMASRIFTALTANYQDGGLTLEELAARAWQAADAFFRAGEAYRINKRVESSQDREDEKFMGTDWEEWPNCLTSQSLIDKRHAEIKARRGKAFDDLSRLRRLTGPSAIMNAVR